MEKSLRVLRAENKVLLIFQPFLRKRETSFKSFILFRLKLIVQKPTEVYWMENVMLFKNHDNYFCIKSDHRRYIGQKRVWPPLNHLMSRI